MSAQLVSASEPGGNNASPQGTTVGGIKPLHRFIKGQPKIIGIVVLIMGMSFLIVTITITSSERNQFIWTAIPPGFLLGTMFTVCGILFILTEHKPSKKTVTISLALSIISILMAIWTIFHIVPAMVHRHMFYRYYHWDDDIDPEMMNMSLYLEVVFVIYTFAGIIIFITMSCMAGAALRSSRTEAVVVMTTAMAETPVE